VPRSLWLVAAAALTTLALSATPARAAGDQSVAYQLDAFHDGYQTAPITAPLQKIWSFSLPSLQYSGTPMSSPLIVNGVVYITVNGTLYAIHQASGERLWSRSPSGTYDVSTIAYDGGRVFAVSFAGTLSAIDATSGAFGWTASLPGQR